MSSKKSYPKSPRKRALLAYRVAIGIFIRYFMLFLFKRFYGKKRFERKLERLHRRSAQKAKNTILKLEGLFIKVGQTLSVMSNILPEAYGEILESMQDRIPPRSFEEITKTLTRELGQPPESLFGTIDQVPLGTASIGQVHRGTLKDGTSIVLKVQHYDIKEIAETDLRVIKNLIRMSGRFFKVKGQDQVYARVRQMIEEELDFRQEVKGLEKIRYNLKDQPKVIVPAAINQFCTEKVLALPYYEGVKINNLETLKAWDIDLTDLCTRLIELYAKMILEDGYYHADPHPGNILVNKNGDIILLDFGATAYLNDRMKEGLMAFFQALVLRDKRGILKAVKQMGLVRQGRDTERVITKLIAAVQEFLDNEVQIDNLNFKDITLEEIWGSSLTNLLNEVGLREFEKAFQIPKDWILLNRTITLLNGLIAYLTPELNPLTVLQPYIKNMMYGPKGLPKQISRVVTKQARTLFAFPGETIDLIRKANEGDLDLNISNIGKSARLLYLLGQQFIWLTMSALSGYLAYRLFQAGLHTWWWITISLCGLATFWFGRSLWRGRRLFRKLDD